MRMSTIGFGGLDRLRLGVKAYIFGQTFHFFSHISIEIFRVTAQNYPKNQTCPSHESGLSPKFSPEVFSPILTKWTLGNIFDLLNKIQGLTLGKTHFWKLWSLMCLRQGM